MKTAVIIAGGKSLRLMPLTTDRPKTLVEVMHKPILYWIIGWLKKYGVEHIVLAVAYKKEEIYKYMKDNDNFGLKVDFSEDNGGGTLQAYKFAIEKFVKDDDFIAMNSDELTNMDLSKMIDKHMKLKPVVTMALAPLDCKVSVVKVDNSGKVAGFEYGKKISSIPVSIGIYVFNRKVVEHISGTGSFEAIVFPELVKSGGILAHMLGDGEEWCTINTVKDVEEAEAGLKRWGLK